MPPNTPGMIVPSPVHQSGNGSFVVVELRDDEPLFDVGARNGAAGLAMPLDMLVGEVDKDGAPPGQIVGG
jgi:hypothetical protein